MILPFPDIIGESLSIEPRFNVAEQELGQLHTVRYRKTIGARFAFSLGFSMLTASEAKSISDLVNTQHGNYEAIQWFMWQPLHWIWVPVGIGNGATTVWTLPSKSTVQADLELFTGLSTPVTPSAFTPGAGADGADTVTITPALATGVYLWANLRGRRRFTCVFESTDQPMQRQADTSTYTFNTRLVQVK